MLFPVYLVRHTSVAVGPTICYGVSDVALAPTWQEEFAEMNGKLPPLELGDYVVLSSPLQRCAQLARHLAGPGLGTVTYDERLKEMDFGNWELRPWASLPRDETEAWLADIVDHHPPGGESFAEVAARAGDFLAGLRRDIPPAGAVVICHGGVIRALLAHVIGCSLEQALTLNVDYGGVTRMEFGDRTRISYVNR